VVEFLNIAVLLYFITLTAGYIALFISAVVGVIHVRRELEGSSPESVSARGRATLPITILCPAHNEEATVVDSVRALLALRYPQHEVVVCNDGSKDKTLQVLRTAFALEPVPFDVRNDLPCKQIRAVYRSGLYKNLVVIDKENGGKADALNCAINAARYPLVCAIDADTLILPDALLRLVRPFLTDVDVVAVGGTICMANGCTIERGEVVEMGLPKSWLARFQVVEYLRAFLVGRLGWDRMGGNLIISGAFGLFRRSAVVASGGYAHDSVGEDMELVARLRHQVPQWLQARAIVHLPDPVSFTEVPETVKILGNQRDRWQRGLADTLWRHRKMAFNRRYGAIGLVVVPFFLFFELFGPIVELFGYVYFVISVIGGVIDPWFAFLFFVLAILLGFMLSLGGILLEQVTLSLYRKRGDLWRLVLVSLLENFGYRQMILWFRLRGIWGYVRGRKTWGRMTRVGFGAQRVATRDGASRRTPLAIALLLIAIAAFPVGWLVKPRPEGSVAVLDKTVPFNDFREHQRLMWLLSQQKAAGARGLLWDPTRDYSGWDPYEKKPRELASADLEGRTMLIIADTYGVYRDDYDTFPRPVAHLEINPKVYGGLSKHDVELIEGFVARGGRILAEFNTFATPTAMEERKRMEKVLNLRWLGWAGRRIENWADPEEVAKWVQQRWAEETGRPFDLEGPGILLIHEDGRVVCLQEDIDIPQNPLTLNYDGHSIPYKYWFDVLDSVDPTEVHGTYKLATLSSGRNLLQKFGLPSEWPAMLWDKKMTHVYIGADVADGKDSLGPPWLAFVPALRAQMAKYGVVSEDVRLLWHVYAPIVDAFLRPGGVPALGATVAPLPPAAAPLAAPATSATMAQ
jgi:cellulose synthase/poly-beta-1,6-N-acetylglucosamine synthase-like glycosyltransferase